MFFTVSSSVSPLVTLDCDGLTLTTSAPRRLPASSNEVRVRVDDSKNRLMMVRPRSAVPLAFPGCRIRARMVSAASSKWVASSGESPSIPSRWRWFHMRARVLA